MGGRAVLKIAYSNKNGTFLVLNDPKQFGYKIHSCNLAIGSKDPLFCLLLKNLGEIAPQPENQTTLFGFQFIIASEIVTTQSPAFGSFCISGI